MCRKRAPYENGRNGIHVRLTGREKRMISMNYSHIKAGTFQSRPNRFIALVEVEGTVEICHVKNTGRCKELLIPGVTVYLEESENSGRKTKYDLIAVKKGERLINIDSQAPNRATAEWLAGGGLIPADEITLLRPECRYGNSRFDFYLETKNRKLFLEVKGVTLEENGAVFFPDAPTERGVKHLTELSACVEAGYEAAVLFLIQMKDVSGFSPNDRTHPAFGEALRNARDHGVMILAYDCSVTPDSMELCSRVPILLENFQGSTASE